MTSGLKPKTMRQSIDPMMSGKKQLLSDSNMLIVSKSQSRKEFGNGSKGMRSGSGTRAISPETSKPYAVRIRDNLANLSMKAEALRTIHTRNKTSMGMSQDWAIRNSNYTQAMAFNLVHATQYKQQQMKNIMYRNQKHQSISDLSNVNSFEHRKIVQFQEGRTMKLRYNRNITKPMLPAAATGSKRPISSGITSKPPSGLSYF